MNLFKYGVVQEWHCCCFGVVVVGLGAPESIIVVVVGAFGALDDGFGGML